MCVCMGASRKIGVIHYVYGGSTIINSDLNKQEQLYYYITWSMYKTKNASANKEMDLMYNFLLLSSSLPSP